MRTALIAAAAATLLACGSALAQVDDMGLPTLDTPQTLISPDGTVGARSLQSVGPVGVPLGAAELATPGISPPPTTGCATATTPGVPAATALFDGGGMAGAVPAGCAQGSGTNTTMPDSAGSTPTPPALSAGRAGIPLGSSEIGGPGLSPMPTTTLLSPTPSSPLAASPTATGAESPPAPLEPPCPVTGTFTSQATTRQSRIGASTSATSSPGC